MNCDTSHPLRIRTTRPVSMTLFFKTLCVLLASAASTAVLQASPVLPHLFSDHMVLQRDMEISVWGRADAGEQITVSIAGQTAQAVAGADGRWKVGLASMDAGGPFILTVRGKTTVTLRDVMIGEVWLASGQSNMTFALSGAANGDAEVSQANYPAIRFFTVPGKISTTPQTDTRAATWKTCTPENAKEFSAVSYFFARKLHENLKVPIGIILSARPGTSAEEWTDPDSLHSEPILKPILQSWEATPPAVKSFAQEGGPIHLEFDDFELLPVQASNDPEPFSNFDNGATRTSTGGDWTYNWEAVPESTFDLVSPGHDGTGYAARVMGTLDGLEFPRLSANFNSNAAPADMSGYDGITFWTRGSGSFQFQVLQPTIYDTDNYGLGTKFATQDWKQVTVHFSQLRQAGWGVMEPFTQKSLTGFSIVALPAIEYPPPPPSGLYNAMIVPLEPYRIRGVLWYQGESNALEAYQYRTLLPALIRGWRKAWDEPGFPFLIVQLPNQGSSPELGDSPWAELREAQLMTLKTVPNTGLAVTIDVGEMKNLHPPRKKEIGERLALWAFGTTYGQKLVYSGPIYEGMQIDVSRIRVRFSHVGSGLEGKDEKVLKGFAIAGADRKFHWADAQIDGDTIVVSSADVTRPVAVRYAWADSPECNLYNKEGLPASPFRTDDWPGATVGNH
jgi:sialate O-acetylesterase